MKQRTETEPEIPRARVTPRGGERLWTKNDVAEYIGLTPSYTLQVIVKRKDFPRSVFPPPAHPRWIAEEVRKWAASRNKKRAAG